MAIDCPEYGPEIVFKGGTWQVTSPDVTTAHAAPTGHSMLDPHHGPSNRHLRTNDGANPTRLTTSQGSITRARRALATRRVQQGYRRSRDILP